MPISFSPFLPFRASGKYRWQRRYFFIEKNENYYRLANVGVSYETITYFPIIASMYPVNSGDNNDQQ